MAKRNVSEVGKYNPSTGGAQNICEHQQTGM